MTHCPPTTADGGPPPPKGDGQCSSFTDSGHTHCTDNLTGFSAAIEAVFPKTEIQNCIIHQLRNSSKDEGSATAALERFSDRWDKKYPKISQSWRDNWANLSTYLKYPAELRRLIYMTISI